MRGRASCPPLKFLGRPGSRSAGGPLGAGRGRSGTARRTELHRRAARRLRSPCPARSVGVTAPAVSSRSGQIVSRAAPAAAHPVQCSCPIGQPGRPGADSAWTERSAALKVTARSCVNRKRAVNHGRYGDRIQRMFHPAPQRRIATGRQA